MITVPAGRLPAIRTACPPGARVPTNHAEREALLTYAAGRPNANLAFERAG
ncbi:hypothetical protein [Streptomyces sp. NPDC058412]|uniref:hypothetical protein n=1 Tax=Streptomyces sp. NPDC058412 TaxID=3346486 RepID=UPI00364A8AF9